MVEDCCEKSKKGFYLRKLCHITLGSLFILFFHFGIKYLELKTTLFFAAIILLVEVIIEYIRVELHFWGKGDKIKHIVKKSETESFSSVTSALVIGIVLFSVFEKNIAFAAMTISIFGDVAAALIGKTFGKIKLCSRGKTFEGFLAYFITGLLVGSIFLPIYICIIISLIAAFAELNCSKIEDNFIIPLLISFIAFLLQVF
jgi:phytol kinase